MAYNVTIRRLEISALFDLKGKAEEFGAVLEKLGITFPEVPNTSTCTGDVELYWIGIDHWLLRAPLAREDDLGDFFGTLPELNNASIVRLSDSLAIFELTGEDALQIMAIASPLDCHPSIFPVAGVTYTEAFGLKALVVRRDTGFELAVDQSFGPMVADYLARAAGGKSRVL